MSEAPEPPKRYSRVGLYIPAFALLVLGIGWSVFWYMSATITGREIGAWIKREAEDGRNWTCPERSVGGYPFRIEISCKNPSFSGPAAGIPVLGRLGAIHLVAQIYDPKLLLGEVEGPFDFTLTQDGSRVAANWKLLQISIRGIPDALQRASLVADNVELTGVVASDRAFGARADNLQVHLRRGAEAQRAYDFAITSTNTTSADLDSATGINAPATLQLSGALTQAETIGPGTIPQLLERWRTAGGSLILDNAAVAKGNLNAQGTGTLHIDGTHRVEGRVDLTASGLAPVLQRYGISPQLLDIGGLIGGLLTGRAPAQNTGQIRVPLTFDHGRLGLGPVKGLALLPPLY
jgi:hypothetical protein